MRTQTSRRSSLRAARMIGLAAMAELGLHHNTDPETPPGGGGGTPPKPNDKPSTDPEKITLTQADLDAKIAAAVKSVTDKAAADAQTEREQKEREELERKGELQKLLDREKAEREKVVAENRRLRTETALRDHLADKHPDYVGVAKYVLPQIPADTKDADLPAAIEKAAGDYVKDNPRQTKGAGGAPPAPPRTGVRGTANGNSGTIPQRRTPSVAASRF